KVPFRACSLHYGSEFADLAVLAQNLRNVRIRTGCAQAELTPALNLKHGVERLVERLCLLLLPMSVHPDLPRTEDGTNPARKRGNSLCYNTGLYVNRSRVCEAEALLNKTKKY